MAGFTAADWRAVTWYAKTYDLKVGRDLIVFPIIRFRDKQGEIVDININAIRPKYEKRPRAKSKKKVEA